MLLIILSLVDIAVGISLIFPNFLGFYLGIIVLIKGISSVVGAFASGFYFDIMGAIDLIAGILLLLSFNIPWFWLLPIIKGLFSLIAGLGSR
jgi:hypothetical protein